MAGATVFLRPTENRATTKTKTTNKTKDMKLNTHASEDGKAQRQQSFPRKELPRVTLTDALAAGTLAHRPAMLQGH